MHNHTSPYVNWLPMNVIRRCLQTCDIKIYKMYSHHTQTLTHMESGPALVFWLVLCANSMKNHKTLIRAILIFQRWNLVGDTMKCILNGSRENSFGVIKKMKNDVAVSCWRRPPIAVSVRSPAVHSISLASMRFHWVWKKENGDCRRRAFPFCWRHNRAERNGECHTHTRHTCSCALNMLPPQARHTVWHQQPCTTHFAYVNFNYTCGLAPVCWRGHLENNVCSCVLVENESETSEQKNIRMRGHRSMYHWMQFYTVSVAVGSNSDYFSPFSGCQVAAFWV